MSESAHSRQEHHAEVTRWVGWALDLDPSEDRIESVRHKLAAEPELLAEVVSLLEAEPEAGDFLDRPALGGLAMAPAPFSEPLEIVGPYRVLRPIGQGGMGTVYLAERADRDYEKQVAIKVADRPGSPEIPRRLRAERSILAQLDHPNIARLYDSGTVRGIPYFVMELVDGTPIDRYCDSAGLDLAARVDLFVRVCRAVEFAHRRLIVHRDLKPGNILVTADGEPKLLDFGLAKLLDPEADAEERTRGAVRPLTPEYASPEQLRGEPITLASDVYSLGVVLYRLLTGELPRKIESFEPARLEAALDQEPPSPRARARRPGRGVTADSDLAAITLKALAVDPVGRYGSMGELLADLERYRAGEPVEAREPTWRYRAAKFLRRHRVGLAAVAGIVAIVVVALLLVTEQGREAARQRNEAERREAQAEQVSSLLVDILRRADPGRGGGQDVTLRSALDRGVAAIEARQAGGAETRATLLETVAGIYHEIGAYGQALEYLSQAIELREAATQPLPLARDLVGKGSVLNDMGRYREAEAALERGVEALAGELGGWSSELGAALRRLGWSRVQLGRYEAAEGDLRRALQIFEGAELATDEAAGTRVQLGELLWATGRIDAAEEMLVSVVETLRKASEAQRGELGLALENLGAVALVRGDLEAAERWLGQSLEVRVETLGPAGTARADSLLLLARVHRARGNLETAERLGREALALAGGDATRVQAAEIVAGVALDRGEIEHAAGELGMLLEKLRARGYGENPIAARVMDGLARAHLRQGDPGAALPYLEQALAIRERVFPAGHFLVGESRLALGGCLLELGRAGEAATQLAVAQRVLVAAFGPEDGRSREATAGLSAARAESVD